MGIVLWLTGLSGSGKSTLASGLATHLTSLGKKVHVLDGDDVRKLRGGLGFSREDIRRNNARIAHHAKEMSESDDVVIVSVISPYREDRAQSRATIGDGYIEVFLNCPLDVCKERDVKGLYKKAIAGEIPDFIGISASAPYEIPENPEIVVRTDTQSIEKSVSTIMEYLRGLEKDYTVET